MKHHKLHQWEVIRIKLNKTNYFFQIKCRKQSLRLKHAGGEATSPIALTISWSFFWSACDNSNINPKMSLMRWMQNTNSKIRIKMSVLETSPLFYAFALVSIISITSTIDEYMRIKFNNAWKCQAQRVSPGRLKASSWFKPLPLWTSPDSRVSKTLAACFSRRTSWCLAEDPITFEMFNTMLNNNSICKWCFPTTTKANCSWCAKQWM